MNYQPLHIHSAFSLGDGLCKVPDLIEAHINAGLGHVMLSDHGNLSAFAPLHFACKGKDIVPVAGCEMYVNDRLDEVLNGEPEASKKIHRRFTSHLILIARNQAGYRNLMQLNNMAVNQFYHKPLVSTEQVMQHREGLMATSACFGGVVGKWYGQDDMDMARDMASIYRDIFGGDFYIELSCVDITSLKGVAQSRAYNDYLVRLAHQLGIETVLSNDVHYMKPEDRHAQYLLQLFREGFTESEARNPGKKRQGAVDHANSMCHETYFKTYSQMLEYWGSALKSDAFSRQVFDGSVQNGIDIAQSKIGQFRPAIVPTMPRPQDMTFDKLRSKVMARFMEKGLDGKGKAYADRIKRELDVMELLKIDSYIAVLDDFVSWTKKNYGRFSMSPGRGSSVSSLVLYCLDITGLDPIKHELLFERFLDESNLESGLSPDIDLDFSKNVRSHVKDYILAKYRNSTNIGTLTEYKWKNLVKDVLRFHNVDFHEANSLSEEIDAEDDKVSFEELRERCPKVHAKVSGLLGEHVGVMDTIHGTFRSNGKHAAGILISDEKNILADMIPFTRYNDQVVTGWDGKSLSDLGFLKYDILGLKNVQVVDDTMVYIRGNRHSYLVADMMTCEIPTFIANRLKAEGIVLEDGGKSEVDIFDDCDMDDPAIYEFANTEPMAYDSVFQFGTDVAGHMLEKARPKNFGDLEAMNAVLRPATIRYGVTDTYIKRMNSGEKTPMPEILEGFLGKTHGIIVFQEQCMQAGMVIGGFTARDAKKVMKTLVKKSDVSAVSKYRDKFIAGSEGKVDIQTAERLWEEMVRMSEYAFCKAHAAAYTLLAVHDLWLKYYYCYEFYTAVLNNLGENNMDKIRDTIHKINGRDAYFHVGTERITYPIRVVPPNVCRPTKEFSLDGEHHIQYGLAYVKSLTEADLGKLLANKTPFASYRDFMVFCLTSNFNRSSFKALVYSGACDVFGESRNSMWYEYMKHKRTQAEHDDGEDSDNLSIEQMMAMESDYCGVSFDMMGESANLSAEHAVEDVKKGGDGTYTVVVTVKDIIKRSSKKSKKPYLLMTTVQAINIFIWDMDKFNNDNVRIGETILCRIQKSGDFCQFSKITGRVDMKKVFKKSVKYAPLDPALVSKNVIQPELI